MRLIATAAIATLAFTGTAATAHAATTGSDRAAGFNLGQCHRFSPNDAGFAPGMTDTFNLVLVYTGPNATPNDTLAGNPDAWGYLGCPVNPGPQ